MLNYLTKTPNFKEELASIVSKEDKIVGKQAKRLFVWQLQESYKRKRKKTDKLPNPTGKNAAKMKRRVKRESIHNCISNDTVHSFGQGLKAGHISVESNESRICYVSNNSSYSFFFLVNFDFPQILKVLQFDNDALVFIADMHTKKCKVVRNIQIVYLLFDEEQKKWTAQGRGMRVADFMLSRLMKRGNYTAIDTVQIGKDSESSFYLNYKTFDEENSVMQYITHHITKKCGNGNWAICPYSTTNYGQELQSRVRSENLFPAITSNDNGRPSTQFKVYNISSKGNFSYGTYVSQRSGSVLQSTIVPTAFITGAIFVVGGVLIAVCLYLRKKNYPVSSSLHSCNSRKSTYRNLESVENLNRGHDEEILYSRECPPKLLDKAIAEEGESGFVLDVNAEFLGFVVASYENEQKSEETRGL